MSEYFNLIESDPWPRLKPRIIAERNRRIDGLLYVPTLESMRQQQGFVEALDWVLEAALPPPPERNDDDDER